MHFLGVSPTLTSFSMSLREGKKREVKLDEPPLKLLGEQAMTHTPTVISSLAEGSSAALEQAN